jgi:hypothetical protein
MPFPYPQETESQMQEFYNRLPEKTGAYTQELKRQNLIEAV